ncbi:uncharacterized protein LOC143285465 [Babylonia areolata]|uniref:uncharacterized protein LOC143285465 n=1 Tax=Babylonia areolata TaxID=304850 RepID=UPI003FD0069C
MNIYYRSMLTLHHLHLMLILTPDRQILSDGEEYEDIGREMDSAGLQHAKTPCPSSEVTQWLDKPDFESSDDADNVDNDNDSDFVPSELEEKPVRAKAITKSTRMTMRKQAKQDSGKRVRLRVPREKPVTEPEPDPASEPGAEPVSEFEPPSEQDQTEPDDDDKEFKPRTKSGRGKHSSGNQHSPFVLRIKRTKSRPSESEAKTPRKRGRPPKPKPTPAEGEDLPPKRPYRKRIPDPSELLLKLRNVGRKPNTRKKLVGEERDAVKTKFVKFISNGVHAVKDSEQSQKVHADDSSSSLLDANDSDGNRVSVRQDSLSSQEAALSSLSMQEESASREKIRCKTCLCLFRSEKFLQEHLSSVSAEDIVQCLACEMKFHGMMQLNMHVFCDHEYEKQPACFLCEEDFASMEKLEKHLNSHHKGQPDIRLSDARFHDCRLCRMELNVDFQLIKNHYYRRHKAYVCPECYGKDVELLYYTDTHLYGEHKQMHAKSPAECPICRVVFPTAREMKVHMWAHAEDPTEDGTGGKCSKCDKWMPNSGAMLMHEKEHKNEAIRKNYALEASIGFPCMKCEHIFSSKSNLKKHSCKADPNRTFYFHCEYCAHGCNTKEQLRDHIALHHLGIKRYVCEYCDQRFVCAPTLRRHVRRVHTKEKPYECHLCKERFYERNLMLRHVSKHTGIASFMCEFCGKGFHTKFDLKKHVENHTDSRDFVCPHCGLDYKRSYHLKRHLEKGCKKKFTNTGEENIPSAAAKVPASAQEDADEMVYLDLAREINIEDDDDENDADMDNYNDESSGPDFGDDVEDDVD